MAGIRILLLQVFVKVQINNLMPLNNHHAQTRTPAGYLGVTVGRLIVRVSVRVARDRVRVRDKGTVKVETRVSLLYEMTLTI